MSKLFLVGVPIGNDGDITFRAVKTLQNVDVIAAEDTRKSKRILDTYEIKPNELIAHGLHNEHASAKGIVSMIQAGKSVAYISDAGMPGVSDPGYLLYKAAIEADVEVETLPAVTAATTAVVTSGLPCDRFSFQGFLPRKAGDRVKKLNALKAYPETLIFYEAPHRILEMLEAMVSVFGNRQASLCRELTKHYEEILRSDLGGIQKSLTDREDIRGEICLVVAGQTEQEMNIEDLDELIQQALAEGQRAKEIRDDLAQQYGLSKKEVYQRILELKA